MAAPKLPQQFGPYTLRELIARGGMAEIFRATMPGVGGFEKTVAIKKILPHLAENDEFITMLIDEARIIVSINHANIAQVYDLGEIDEDYYIAMEYIHGIDLSGMVKELKDQNRTVPVEHALFITSGIAAGLHVAHNKCDASGRPLNIVHRDVSPHNILISYAGDVKIIDFGVAKARGKEAHTQLGVIKGKLLYMAPEQAMAKELDGRADLFAMGLILYRMLTNHLPFEGDNEFQIYNHILSKEITPPRAFNPDIPEEVNQIVLMLLQRDPSKRYQDGYSAKVDLDRALQSVAPGYSISRLSRWVEDDFSHLIQRRMAKSGQNANAGAPSTPSHNNVTGGDLKPPGWDVDWDDIDDIDENEDTINLAMDSPEAQAVMEQAERERARYKAMRATGEIPAPGPAPWEQQQGPQQGQVPQPQQSGQWGQPQAYQPQEQAPPYGSGQFQAPMQQQPQQQHQQQQWGDNGAGQSGQWAQNPQAPPPQQSGQWPQPPAAGQSGGYPVNQSGGYPVNQSGGYPVNQSGGYPVNQSGGYPVNQSGMYAAPNQSGQFQTPNGSGMYQSPHYQPFQGPSPLRPDGAPHAAGSNAELEADEGSSLWPKVLLLIVMAGVVGFLGWQYFMGGEAPPVEPDEVVPEESLPVDGQAEAVVPEEGAEVVAEAQADAGAAAPEEPASDRTVEFEAESEPDGADVFVNGKLIGQTPLQAPIPWGEAETPIRFELEGYRTQELEAIPFDDFRRSVELMPDTGGGDEPDEGDAPEEPGEEVEKVEKKPKPKPKRRTKRRKRKPKVEEKKDPSIPLLLEDKPKPKSDVPVF